MLEKVEHIDLNLQFIYFIFVYHSCSINRFFSFCLYFQKGQIYLENLFDNDSIANILAVVALQLHIDHTPPVYFYHINIAWPRKLSSLLRMNISIDFYQDGISMQANYQINIVIIDRNLFEGSFYLCSGCCFGNTQYFVIVLL